MPKKEGYLNEIDYVPTTHRGKKLMGVLDRLDQRERIYIKEKNALIKRQAVVSAKKRLGIIKPVSPGKKFRSFIGSKIKFG